MYRFYRLGKDEQGNDILTVVDLCAIQADRIPSVPAKYHNVLFFLGIDTGDRIVVRNEYSAGVPEGIVDAAEAYINSAPDKGTLPTYYYDHILLNGVERIPHLHLVYIAENEDAVWDILKG